MLYMTDQAVLALAHALDLAGVPEDRGYRIYRDGPKEFRLEVEPAHDGDEVARTERRAVLFVPPEVQQSVNGGMLDITLDAGGETEVGIRLPEDREPTGWVPVPIPQAARQQ
jgi:hypothetical protein